MNVIRHANISLNIAYYKHIKQFLNGEKKLLQNSSNKKYPI